MGDVPLVLVTGASGYIAAHCIKLLLDDGKYRVRGTVRSLKNEERCEAIRNLSPDAKYPIELVEAQLLEEECWKSAVAGCTYILHIASPFVAIEPKDEDELIKPAVNGTLNVLHAAVEAGSVKRVVLTSSIAAVSVGIVNHLNVDESSWSDITKTPAYPKSKTLAEKAAWDYVNDLPGDKKFELAVINPGFVLGPVLIGTCTSVSTVKSILMREMPMVPEIMMGIIDVRDVAKAEIIAMTLPEAAGNRHILTEDTYSFLFLAKALAPEFDSQGYNVPTTKAPKFMMWALSWFDAQAKAAYPFIGQRTVYNNARMLDVLKIKPIPISESVVEMAHTMIERGLVKKSEQYKGRKVKE